MDICRLILKKYQCYHYLVIKEQLDKVSVKKIEKIIEYKEFNSHLNQSDKTRPYLKKN